MFVTLAVIVFLFRFTYFSRIQVFGSVLLLVLFVRPKGLLGK